MPWLHWLPWLPRLYGGTVQPAHTWLFGRKSGFVALKRFSILLAAVLGCILFFLFFFIKLYHIIERTVYLIEFIIL